MCETGSNLPLRLIYFHFFEVIRTQTSIVKHIGPWRALKSPNANSSCLSEGAQTELTGLHGEFYRVVKQGSCHKRQKPQAPTPQAPIRNRQTRKVANAKVLNRNTNQT